MVKKSLFRAALVLSGSAVVLAGSVLSASAATTGWRVAATVKVKQKETVLTTVTAPGRNDAWASGISATSSGKEAAEVLEHWAGKSWKAVSLPSAIAKKWANSGAVFQVAGASSTNLWVFAAIPFGPKSSTEYFRLDGKRWTSGTLPNSSAVSGHSLLISSVSVLGASNAWVFGGEIEGSASGVSLVPYAAHFNGLSWSASAVWSTTEPAGSAEITSVSVVSPDNIWAVTGASGFAAEVGAGSGGGPAVVLHWNGSKWAPAAVQPAALPAGADLTAVSATRSDVTIAGAVPGSEGRTVSEFADQFNGTAWAAPVTLPKSGSAAGAYVESLVPAGRDLWALSGSLEAGKSQLSEFNGKSWGNPLSPKLGGSETVLFQLAAIPGTSSIWGAGVTGGGKVGNGLIAIEGPTPK